MPPPKEPNDSLKSVLMKAKKAFDKIQYPLMIKMGNKRKSMST